MKYLKYTAVAFIASIILSFTGVSALVVELKNITIPIFSGEWMSGFSTKQNWSVQSVMKTRCTDAVSGDGRVIRPEPMRCMVAEIIRHGSQYHKVLMLIGEQIMPI